MTHERLLQTVMAVTDCSTQFTQPLESKIELLMKRPLDSLEARQETDQLPACLP